MQKIMNFEQLIDQLRKMLDLEKKNNFQVRTMLSRELDTKKALEKIMRSSIDDVRDEIDRKRNET